jgi:kynurenine formamidase
MIVELGQFHEKSGISPGGAGSFARLRAMVCESVGPVTHEVSVPFHDSQVRGVALLIQTGWDQYWGTDAYWNDPPFLAEHLIFRMIRSTVKIVGVDFPVAGRSSDTRLVTTGKMPIVENLRGLSALPRLGFHFNAIPQEESPRDICVVHAFAELP